ncbi:MAG: hypothetical protein RLZZ444_3020, partial [Pseudomonadota bacterium]
MTIYVGSEVQDNNLQSESFGNVKVTALANGGFAIAWRFSSQDAYLRTFDASGTAATTDEVHALTGAANLDYYGFDITGTTNDGVELAWCSYGADGSGNGYGISHLSFTNDGSVDGIQGIVNSATYGPQIFPSIAEFGDGGWIAAYSSWGYGTTGGYAVTVRAFDSSGNVVSLLNDSAESGTGDRIVNQNLGINPMDVEIATLANGGFVVSWTSGPINPNIGQDGSYNGIFHRVFNADGSAVTDETQVNIGTDVNQDYSSVTALAGGGYVITWEDSGSYDGENRGIFQQFYNANGVAQSETDILVNTSITGNQYRPDVAALENGGWVVVWQSGHGGDSEIYQKVYAADGTVLMDETQVSSTTGQSFFASVTGIDDGGWVVAWNAVGKVPGDEQSVHHRQFGFTYEAPSGFDKAVKIKEDVAQTLSANYFGFSDDDGNAMKGVIISSLPTKGALKLNGVAVTTGQTIDAADLGNLTYTPPANAFGTGLAKIGFKVVDDGGTAYDSVDTDASENYVTFNITDVVDVFNGTNA